MTFWLLAAVLTSGLYQGETVTATGITTKVVALTRVISDANDHFELHCSGTFVDLTGDATSLLITAGHCPLEVGQSVVTTNFDANNVLNSWTTIGTITAFSKLSLIHI